MKHWQVYEQLMRKAYARGLVKHGYCETHHVIPRSLGGSDHPENLVELTFREHFIAHWLLSKMFTGFEKKKMAYALYAMAMGVGGRVVTSWQFDLIKRLLADQKLATRRQREEFKRQLKRERASKQFSETSLLIEKFRAGEIKHQQELDKVANLITKHRRPVRLVRGRHVPDKIAEALIGREVKIDQYKNKKHKKSWNTHEERLAKYKAERDC